MLTFWSFDERECVKTRLRTPVSAQIRGSPLANPQLTNLRLSEPPVGDKSQVTYRAWH